MHQADMPPTDCLISATIKATDLIAVPENPLEDISVMLNINFVMARGNVVKE